MRSLATILLLATLASAAPARTIAKQPKYVTKPLYALFLFGDKGDVPVWMVLDKSKPDIPFHDVCYIDKNANGDLTEDGERFDGKWTQADLDANKFVLIRLGELTIGKYTHTDLKISTIRKGERKGIWLQFKWRGKHELSGGMTMHGDSTIWAETPEKAPVLRPSLTAPFVFQFWGWGARKVELPVGGKPEKVYLMAGVRGSRDDTLLVVDENFLKPGRDRLFATVIAKTADGQPVEARTEISGHC
ncbi:MAG: hypothetical protein ACYTGN_03795 [Planctomycetota bacterium]|jgi:hypothetical protein